MKKQYIVPESVLAMNAPIILEVEPGSDNGGEYQPGMPVDAPRRDELDEDAVQKINKDNWQNGLW